MFKNAPLRSLRHLRLSAFLVLVIAISFLAAVKPVHGQRGAGDTLRIFLWQAPTTLNPHLANGQKDTIPVRLVYEPLASFDKDGKLIPFLAAEIPSLENGDVAKDGKSVTWKLKQGVKWSDGEPFTAKDVVFTYTYITNKDVGAYDVPYYSLVSSVEVIDDNTVKVNFKDVNPAWSLSFVGEHGLIFPEHVFKDYNGANAKEAPANLKPVGTGPYRLVEFKNEDILIIGEDTVNTVKLTFEPNPLYRDADKPYFSKVEVRGGGGDAKYAARIMQDGQADYAWNLQVDDATRDKIEAKGKSIAVSSLGATVERVIMNFTDPNKEATDGERSSIQFPHPFFSDKKVRQAFEFALDRDTVAKAYGRGGQRTTNLLVAPPSLNSPNTSYVYDPAKAAALLDEAGWKDTDGDGIRDKGGVKLSVVYQTSVNAIRQKNQDIIKKNLEAVGIEVNLKKIDASVYFGPVKDSTNTVGQFYADLEEFANSNKNPDPGAYMNYWTCAQSAQKANNWNGANSGRYCNADYDALYQQSTTIIDPEKRRQLFIKMNDMLIDDVALIPLAQLVDTAGVSTNLAGFSQTPWDDDTWNVADWRRK